MSAARERREAPMGSAGGGVARPWVFPAAREHSKGEQEGGVVTWWVGFLERRQGFGDWEKRRGKKRFDLWLMGDGFDNC
jgi:hypothetical protein